MLHHGSVQGAFVKVWSLIITAGLEVGGIFWHVVRKQAAKYCVVPRAVLVPTITNNHPSQMIVILRLGNPYVE